MTTWPFIIQLAGFTAAMSLPPTSHLACKRLRNLRPSRNQNGACDKGGPDYTTERHSPWQNLLDEYNHCDDHGPQKAHRARAYEHGHQSPATSQAVETVLQPQAELTCHARIPVGQEEVHRAAADPQAGRLQRCELVSAADKQDGGDCERPDPHREERIADPGCDPYRDAGSPPDQHIGPDEDPGSQLSLDPIRPCDP